MCKHRKKTILALQKLMDLPLVRGVCSERGCESQSEKKSKHQSGYSREKKAALPSSPSGEQVCQAECE